MSFFVRKPLLRSGLALHLPPTHGLVRVAPTGRVREHRIVCVATEDAPVRGGSQGTRFRILLRPMME